ncbi:putative amino acid transporter [Plectosphaerella plurivora]|uniref:Amino acid transporter n=1 Tax=Plectosphaerella plurivora TaxID=936078 RepID=A0A9P9AF26_9PEZI|nr:putative amino acid transporter [Plectosphaerella plurivora]
MEKSAKNVYGDEEAPAPAESVIVGQTRTQDAVFGELTEDGPNYRSMGWIGTVAIMMKLCIGLGVLSIPATFDVFGIVPGTIMLVSVGVLATWSCYVVGCFKLNHPEVYGIDDAGFLMFGRVGREFYAVAFCLCYIFVSGAGILGVSVALNALSVHGTCTAVFVAVAAIIAFAVASIQTLGRLQGLAWFVFTLTIAVGVQDRPAAAPQDGPWESDFAIAKTPTFARAASAMGTYVFAYAAAPLFFPVIAEMRDPRDYTKALLVCQSGVTITYVVIGCVVYYYCGSYVASPALGSAGVLLKKVCYGIGLPGIILTTVLCLHLPAKYIFVRLLRGTVHLSKNTKTHWIVWLSCTAGSAVVAYIVASAIPIFGNLVSLVGALLITVLAFQTMACMWLYDHWHAENKGSTRWMLMVGWCSFVIAIGTFMTIAGTYGSISEIVDSYRASGGTSAWSCADNSNST